MVSALNHAFHNGYDKNGTKINDKGGDETDYLYDDDGNIIASTEVAVFRSEVRNKILGERGYGYKISLTSGALYDPSWDILGGTLPVGKLFSGFRLINQKFIKATGGFKQWIRFGKSYSHTGKFKTYSARWGAGRNHYKKIGNSNLQNLNRSLRNYKIPYNSWRTADPGHFHFKKLR